MSPLLLCRPTSVSTGTFISNHENGYWVSWHFIKTDPKVYMVRIFFFSEKLFQSSTKSQILLRHISASFPIPTYSFRGNVPWVAGAGHRWDCEGDFIGLHTSGEKKKRKAWGKPQGSSSPLALTLAIRNISYQITCTWIVILSSLQGNWC